MDSHEKQGRVQFGPFQADLRSGELHCEGKRIPLQDQPFHVLCVLLERAGELVTREELRSRVWPSNTFLEFDYALNTAIKKIRIALSDDAVAPRYVQTIPKRGYRWIAPVTLDGRKDAPASQRTVWAASIRILIGGVLLGLLLSSFVRPASHELAEESLTLTVGPVQNGTGDRSFDLLCEGISRQLTAYLVQSDLSPKIISPALQVTKGDADASDLTKVDWGFRAQYGVEASLRTVERRVHVDVGLSRTRNHSAVWAGSFEHELGNPLQVEADLAREISVQVVSALHRVARAGTLPQGTPMPAGGQPQYNGER
jgi:DNA-binding winged helix-turn-helix (wHTH) protein/TolB-like protein